MVSDFGLNEPGRPTSESIFDVSYEIFFRLRVSLILAGFAFLLSLLVGIPLGITAALKSGSMADRIISTGTLLTASIPSYTLAVIVMVDKLDDEEMSMARDDAISAVLDTLSWLG